MEIENIRSGLDDRHRYRVAELNRMAEQINKTPLMLRRHTQLSVDTSIGRVIIKIIDTKTDTVIKELPPATLQKMYRNIREHLNDSDLATDHIDV